ncbi:MAG: hypothetical protein NTY04_02505 [Candidatus Staskawiczbacteria bacterium]|nr:hypothetical protein [Candidatus Staskawiczbacteria bacterium]
MLKNNNKVIKPIILIILVSFLLVPTIAFASWWNPFSWGIWNNIFHKADTKTQILENRVKELESKLNSATTTKPVIEDVVKTTPKTTVETTPKTTTASPASTATPKCSKYIDPATGQYFKTAEDYGNYVATKIPVCDAENKVLDMSNPIKCDGTVNCITYTQSCQNDFGTNSIWSGKLNSNGSLSCGCRPNYQLNSEKTECVEATVKTPLQICQEKFGVHSIPTNERDSNGDRLCGCEDGYLGNGQSCQLKQVNDFENAPYRHDGNAYSPEQLNAMDCASYGINCPTINVRIVK